MRKGAAILFGAGLTLAAVAATFAVKTLPLDGDAPGPSLLAEAEHALDLADAYLDAHPAETNVLADVAPLTNGLSRAAVVRRLVSAQRADGRWEGSNMTATAARLLRELAR